MKELQSLISEMEAKREQLLSRMEKGYKLLGEAHSSSDRAWYEVRLARLERAYHRLVLAIAVLRLDQDLSPS